MMYDTKPYFSEYAENISKVVEDLCGISGGMLCGEQIALRLKLATVARFPIFRGYTLVPKKVGDVAEADSWNRHYMDVYQFDGKTYISEELSKKLKDHTVRFDMLVKNNKGEYTKHLSIGIKELFYYKENIDGVPKDYYTDKDGNKLPENEEKDEVLKNEEKDEVLKNEENPIQEEVER